MIHGNRLTKGLVLIALVSLANVGSAAENAAETNSAGPIEEIVVVGRATEFYLQTAPSLGNKFPGDLRDIPQSIQILPNQLIKDQAAIEITDLYRNISSVSVFSYSGVTFRGFRQDEIRYDGLQGDPFSGFSVPLLFDIEQVEIIKGPSGALFGGGEPGGLINYVTKRPSETFESYISGSLGSYDLAGVRGEASGPLTRDGTVLFRLAGAFEDTDTFRRNTNKEDSLISASVEWRPDEATSLLVRYEYIDQDFQGARLRGVPVDEDGDFLTSRRFNTNEASDFQRLEANVLQLSFDRALTDNAALTLAARYIDSDEIQNYHENRGLFVDPSGTTFARREFRDQQRDIEQLSALAELTFSFTTGPLEHTTLAGVEYYDRSNEDFFLTSSDSRRAGQLPPNFIVPDLNFFNPEYGNSNPALFDPLAETDRTVEFEEWAVYLQDQIQLTDRLLISLGARYEAYTEDLDSTQTVIPLASVSRSVAEEDDNAITIRTGVVYDLTDQIALYANYSTGFTPQGASSQDFDSGGPFDPETGQLFEVGGKIDLFRESVYLQLAVYQIDKQDLLVADPTPGAPTGAVTEIGEARSRGIELDLVGDLTENWTFTFSYAYNETKILEGSDEIGNAVGDEFANAPDHQLGVWTRYDFPAINSAFAIGAQYVSEQISLGGQTVQAFEVFDASWISDFGPLQLQLNVRNLFDKEYAESGFIARTGHFPGRPRTVRAELTYFF